MSCPYYTSNNDQASQAEPQECPARPGVNTDTQKQPSRPTDEPIPQPPTHWFTGNLSEIDPSFPNKSTWRLAEIYGPIYKLDMIKSQTLVISNYELINDASDEDRFEKSIDGGLAEVRQLLGDGLFTAYNSEMNWWTAHRILMPVFGPLKIRQMFPEMMDIASQLVLKWDRLGPDHDINISDDFTRLAFDTIAFCSFSYRFNSFYSAKPHEFAQQMADVLIYCGQRASRTAIENYLRIPSHEVAKHNIQAMWDVCDQLVTERKAHPQPDCKDLLNTMLFASDSDTGEKLSDESIRFNMATFLVAGHETTSGTLSFLFYHLMHNPEKYHKAQAEVDEIVGDGALELKHISQMKYLEACLRETLRFQGPIGRINFRAKEDTYLANKYHCPKGINIGINIQGLHHDPAVWGQDHDQFRPERMLDGKFEALPPNAFKPFGNGRRACIGRTFAEQEMMITTALLLQRFQFEMSDPSYDLRLKSTLTVKPDGLFLRVRRRPGKTMMTGISGAPTSRNTTQKDSSHEPKTSVPAATLGDKDDVLIIYGSNAGTCKSLAEDLQSDLANHGLRATVETMNKATETLPERIPTIIITPSYEGKPADNAKTFVAWLESDRAASVVKGRSYGVFGAGNSDWTGTYHKVPKLVDGRLNELGAKPLVPMGLCDVKEDLVGPWDAWKEEILAALSKDGADSVPKPSLSVTVETPSSAQKLGGKDLSEAAVIVSKEIAGTAVGPAKRHMEVELPAGTTYRTGDYIVVQPVNPQTSITRALTLFKLHPDDLVRISGTTKAFLTENNPTTAIELIGARLELATPVSQRQLQIIATTNTDKSERKQLEALASDDNKFKSEVLAKRMSILDVLEDYPHCNVGFEAFLDWMKPLSSRQYSISSSPLAHGTKADGEEAKITASITYDVHKAPAFSGNNRTFQGVASTYLATRAVNSKIRCSIRPTNTNFHLPSTLDTPIIMVCAGSGIAPMRGFCQERAEILKANPSRQVGKAILYFGCRDSESDYIYADELAEWEKLGAVEVRPVFSRSGPGHEQFKYVPDRIWAEREEVSAMFRGGAKILLCGSAGKLGKSTSEVCKRIWLERNSGRTEVDAEAWLEGIKEDRYVSDVFD